MQVLGRWGVISNVIYSEMIDYPINPFDVPNIFRAFELAWSFCGR